MGQIRNLKFAGICARTNLVQTGLCANWGGLEILGKAASEGTAPSKIMVALRKLSAQQKCAMGAATPICHLRISRLW